MLTTACLATVNHLSSFCLDSSNSNRQNLTKKDEQQNRQTVKKEKVIKENTQKKIKNKIFFTLQFLALKTALF